MHLNIYIVGIDDYSDLFELIKSPVRTLSSGA